MRRILVCLAGTAVALLLACAAPSSEVTQFDLGLPYAGPVSPDPDPPPKVVTDRALAEVSAPGWLDTGAIVYRLAYDDASQVRTYAKSRWAAAPARLLLLRLRERLPLALPPDGAHRDGSPAGEDLLLRIELEEFSQVFDTPRTSHALLRARATLVDIGRHELYSQRVFEVQRPAPSPDALGAVHGLRDAVDEFLTELLRWMDQASIDKGA